MATNKPIISVIIPIYNPGEFLSPCITSILGQSIKNIEVICIDDGSSDGSGQLLEEYANKDDRVRVIKRSKPSGSAALPRNVGLQKAEGEYVSVVDSDDWFDEHMLENMYNTAVKYNADLVMCDNYVVKGSVMFEDGELHQEFIPALEVFSYKDIPKTIFQISNATAWHKLIKKELIDRYELKFQEGVPILDDICFVNLVDVLAKRIAIINEKYVYYRAENDNAQTTKVSRHYMSLYFAFTELISQLKGLGIYNDVSESLKIWIINTCEWWLSCIHDYDAYCNTLDLLKANWFNAFELNDLNINRLPERLLDFYYCLKNYEHGINRKEMIESIPIGSKVVIYGAGIHGKKAFSFVSSYGKHSIVAWADKNYNKLGSINGVVVVSPDQLNGITYDYIIIAIYDNAISNNVKDYLINRGVNKEAIMEYR